MTGKCLGLAILVWLRRTTGAIKYMAEANYPPKEVPIQVLRSTKITSAHQYLEWGSVILTPFSNLRPFLSGVPGGPLHPFCVRIPLGHYQHWPYFRLTPYAIRAVLFKLQPTAFPSIHTSIYTIHLHISFIVIGICRFSRLPSAARLHCSHHLYSRVNSSKSSYLHSYLSSAQTDHIQTECVSGSVRDAALTAPPGNTGPLTLWERLLLHPEHFGSNLSCPCVLSELLSFQQLASI